MATSRRFIPVKQTIAKPYTHHWINEQCVQLLRLEHAAIQSVGFIAARDKCTAAFASAHSAFIRSTRQDLQAASSKDWWKTANSLLARGGQREDIPPLSSKGVWAKTAVDKAELLASIFSGKGGYQQRSATNPRTSQTTVFLYTVSFVCAYVSQKRFCRVWMLLRGLGLTASQQSY